MQKIYSIEEKERLCQRLTELTPSQAKDVYALIIEHAKENTTSFPRQLGNKSTVPFGGKQEGSDFEFNIGNFPPTLLAVIERLLDCDDSLKVNE